MEKQNTKSIIISSKPGQLGNMLFLFAHFISFGIEKNRVIKAPAFEQYAGYFDSVRDTSVPSYPKNNSTTTIKLLRRLIYHLCFLAARIIFKLKLNNRIFSSIYIDWDQSFDLEKESNLKLFNSRYTFVQGWLYRSNSLLQKHKETIVNFFSPNQIYTSNVNKVLSCDYEILIGIHRRQGDYKTFEGGKYFFKDNQYIALMEKVLTLLPGKKVLFLICSNSALKHEDFSKTPHILGTGVEIEDLYAFSKCNYLIGPPSTFTMWASFYGKVPLYQVHTPDSTFTLEDFKVVLG